MIEYHGDITPEEQEEIVRRRAEWKARADAYNDAQNHPVRSSARQLARTVDIEADNSQQDEW